jgi:hypothetical protein
MLFDLSSNQRAATTLSTKGESQMETVNFGLPPTQYPESNQEYQNSFWRWFEKLSSIGEMYFVPDWLAREDQDPDKWPFY